MSGTARIMIKPSDAVAWAECARWVWLDNFPEQLGDFDDSFRTAIDFLSNPHQLWDAGHIEDRHAVMKLTFANRLAYKRGEGFRTPETTLPFKALGSFREGENKMARLGGFEPPTARFVAEYSIQLSYKRICCFLLPPMGCEKGALL